MKIDGKQIASQILQDLKKRVVKLKEKGITPHLYIVTFGENPQTESYLKQKLLKASEIGAEITIKRFPLESKSDEIKKFINSLNKENNVHGIIVQRPLIEALNEAEIANIVALDKDVDGFHSESKFSVPVAQAVLKMIETTIKNQNLLNYLNSQNITVIGKGTTAGKPIINIFKKQGINTNIIDSKTSNRDEILISSDIIISAVGKKILGSNDIKKGVTLIGVGMHTDEFGKLKGDYDEEEIKDRASFFSPTPGGVGPVNVAMLMKNLIQASENLSS